MDPKYINEIFRFYEPADVNLQWLHDALEQMNTNDVLVDLSIATMTCGFLVGFYRYRRSRQAKAGSPSNSIAQKFSNVDLQEHCDIETLRDSQPVPEIILSPLTVDIGANLFAALINTVKNIFQRTNDSSDSSTSCLFENANANDDNTDPLLLNINTPKKDVLDSKEKDDATGVTRDNAAKVIYRKAIQDGVNMRLQLLLAKKKIYAQMKQMQILKKSLLESSTRNYAQDNSFNKTPNSISISRRKSFFDVDHTDKTFLISSSSVEPKAAGTKKDEKITKLMNLKKNVSQLTDAHMNELSSLNDRLAEKQMWTKKLEAMKKEIDLLYEMVENEDNKNKESADNNKSDQDQAKNSSYDNNVNQLQSISSRRDLFKSYDNGRDLSTIMEKTNENTDDSLVLLNDISTLQADLNSLKKQCWSRSSTPRKPSPGAQPTSS